VGFVKTAEEIARIIEVTSHPRFVNAEMLQVEFLTDPSIVAAILPPPLEPASTPLVRAMVGTWQSNCVGDYNGGSLYVAAKYGDIEADYVLAMYISTYSAITFGREIFGEAKKMGTGALTRKGSRMSGYVERDGVRLIELEADLQTDLGPSKSKGTNFNIKTVPATDGRGLEDDPMLTLAEFDVEMHANREGSGSVVLRGTSHDPLDEIEVVKVLKATYFEGDLIGQARNLARIPAADFLPYYYARQDDWSCLDTERWR
jgi:acetoacetate decarboxylase